MGICAVDAGISICKASWGLNLVVRMKKVSNRKATSHMAVMSTNVLFLGILTFGIVYYITGCLELMFCGKSLGNAEACLINAISQSIDLCGKVIVEDDRQCRCADTKCSIDEGF